MPNLEKFHFLSGFFIFLKFVFLLQITCIFSTLVQYELVFRKFRWSYGLLGLLVWEL